jgi:hypothetical protein
MALVIGLGALRCADVAAQAGIAGRWRIDVYEITPAPLYGELMFADSAGALIGRAEFSNRNGPPVALSQILLSDAGLLQFVVPGEGGTLFRGRAPDASRRMRGQVAADGGRLGRWTAERLDPSIEFYPVLPQFRLRQLVGGVGGAYAILPGALAAAAAAELPRAGLPATYERVARASGLAPLSGAQLQNEGPGRVLGFTQRAEVLAAVQHTLEQVRAALPSDTARAEFDAIFRPGGSWRLDLHGAALDIARLRSRRLQWDDVLPALLAAGSIGDSSAAASAVPGAMERLLMLRSADSTAMARLLAGAAATAPVSARSLSILLAAYPEAEDWHRQALAFLLRARWVSQDGAVRSPAEIVRTTWLAIMPGDSARAHATPAVTSQLFGHPQAVPRYGASAASMNRLVTPLNWSGQRWLDRHGSSEMLALLHLLASPGSGELLVARADETLRVVSVKQRAGESTSGFLERQEAIAVEPGYIPVLALGALLHEWGHLLAEGWRFDQAVLAAPDSGEVALPAVSPWLVEGIAEAWTDLVLAPIMARQPLIGFAETEKRVRLSGNELDPHVTGYLMVRAAIGAAATRGTSAPASIRHLIEVGDPAKVAAHPLFAAAFRDPGDVAPLIIPAPSRRFLVPESIFTVDTNFPDPVSTIIRTPE